MLSTFPAVDGDAIAQARLLAAWVRRKRFEARLVALEVGKLFASEPENEYVSEAEILARAGIKPVVIDGS